MKSATRLALLMSFISICLAVAWDFTPLTAGRSTLNSQAESSHVNVKPRSARKTSLGAKSLDAIFAGGNLNVPVPEPSIMPEASEDGDEDPDLPPGMAGKVDKEAYLLARGDQLLRFRLQGIKLSLATSRLFQLPQGLGADGEGVDDKRLLQGIESPLRRC